MNISSLAWNTDKDDPQILTINIPKLKIGPVKGSKITKVTGAHNPIYLELSVARTTLVFFKNWICIYMAYKSINVIKIQ